MQRIKFCYVDFWSGRGSWRRIRVSEIEQYARKQKFHNCYVSAQFFENPTHLEGELTFAPLFFDLDSKDDIDIARQDAIKIVDFFFAMGLNKEYVRIFFSGAKGFHIIISPEVLDITPSPELAMVFKQIAYNLTETLGTKTIDMQAYSVRRLLRLTDSLHPNSGKYKVELYPEELKLSVEEIKNLAKAPRGPIYEAIEYSGLQPDGTASLWYKQFTEQFSEEETLTKLRPRNIIKACGSNPVCVNYLLTATDLPISNTGNKAVLALSAYHKDIGKTEQETKDIITKWIVGINNCGDAGKEGKLKAMVTTTVRFVYEQANKEKYHFACSFIRALGSSENKIPCEYDKCKLIGSDTDQEPETPIELHLSEASRAEYQDHKLLIPAMISGKEGAPYIVPKEIAAKCLTGKRGGDCNYCLLKESNDYDYEFNSKDKELLEFINTSKDMIIGVIRRKLGASKCKYCSINIKSYCNIETIRLVPVVDDMRYGAQQHVVRVCYNLGHGIALNNKYKITAYTYTNPKTQLATHLISSVEPYNTSLDNFKMDQEIRKELLIFQRSHGQSVADKFNEIHADYEANVYRIWGRSALAFGIDLVYHSVISFVLKGQLLERGWCELLVVGDSCQGKSETMKRLRGHYGLGEATSGETAKRTGLVYNFQETQSSWMLQWGRIPLNDRGLVFIDEFSGLSTEDIAGMSDLRSTGKVTVHGIQSDETNSRTRLIFLSNSREGRPLNSYTHGVEAIRGIMSHAEDIRRLDFALTVASGEVPAELLNRQDIPKCEHRYTSFLSQQLVLWAWSRRAEDIVILPEAEKRILEKAVAMSKKYYAKIPLVEPADQRIKIARLSVAAAVRVFSTDDTGEKVIVTPDHVDFVFDYLNKNYDTPSMGYDAYSEEESAKSFLTPEQSVSLKAEFNSFKEPSKLKKVLLRTTTIKRSLLEDMMGYSKEEARNILKWLTLNNLIDDKKFGYVKTPHFITLLKEIKINDTMTYPATSMDEFKDFDFDEQ